MRVYNLSPTEIAHTLSLANSVSIQHIADAVSYEGLSVDFGEEGGYHMPRLNVDCYYLHIAPYFVCLLGTVQ